MKRINKYISLLLATALLASCDKFDEINSDPDGNRITAGHYLFQCQ